MKIDEAISKGMKMIEVENMAGLKKNWKRNWKRKIAGFLAVCMMASSVQSTAFATATGSYETANENVVLSLSMDHLRTAIKEAIAEGWHYDGSMDFFGGEGDASKYAEFLRGDNVFELISIPYADFVFEAGVDPMPEGAQMRIFVRADETQLKKMAQKATDSDAAASLSELTAPEYEILGTEEVIFIFTNGSEENLSFQLNVDGNYTPVIYVPSGETMGYGIASKSEAEEESQEETEEELDNSVSIGGETADDTTDNPETEESSKEEDDEKTQAESKESTEADDEDNPIAEKETEASDVESSQSAEEKDSEEIKKPSVSEEHEKETEDSKKPEEDNSSEIERPVIKIETEETPKSEKPTIKEDTKVEIVGDKETDKEQADPIEKDEPEDAPESNDSSDDQVVSISSYAVPRVMTSAALEENEEEEKVGPAGLNSGDGYVPDDMDWDDWYSAEDDEDEYYTADYRENEATSSEASYRTIEGTVLEPVFVKSTSAAGAIGLFILLGIGDEEKESVETAALYASSVNALAEGEISTDDFKVTLYEYSGIESDQKAINEYLANLSNPSYAIRFDSTNGVLGNDYSGPNGSQTLTQNYNVVQGLVPKTYEGDSFANDFLSSDILFPAAQPSNVGKNTIEVYPEVTLGDGFFTSNEDYSYVFNSNDKAATLNKNQNTLEVGTHGNVQYPAKGFWPLGIQQEHFGMKMQFSFYMPEDGMFNGKPLKFAFSGDDDVWIYLNESGKDTHYLALDLGGIHGRMDGTIDFNKGEVEYSNQNAVVNGEKESRVISYVDAYPIDGRKQVTKETAYPYYVSLFSKEDAIQYRRKTTGASQAEATEYVENRYVNFMNLPLDFDKKQYDMDFYFLERGGYASNCIMNFNLPVVPSNGITVQKQVQGTQTLDKTKQYSFRVYQAAEADKEELVKAYKGQEFDSAKVSVTEGNAPYRLKAGGSFNVDVSDGYWFFVEETDAQQATRTSWGVVGGNNVNISAVESMKTEPQQMTAENGGYLITFTNEFGIVDPDINKSAWQREDGTYNMALEVTGASTNSLSGVDSGANVLFILDSSGSMSFDMDRSGGKEFERWYALQDAIDISLDDLATKSNIKVGMFDFDSSAHSEFKLNNERWIDLSAETLPELKKHYHLNKDTIVENNYDQAYAFTEDNGIKIEGGTQPQNAFNKVIDDEWFTEDSSSNYVIFVCDGKPDPDSAAVESYNAGQALRTQFPSMNIYTIGVSSGVTDDWWMNSDATKGKALYLHNYDGKMYLNGVNRWGNCNVSSHKNCTVAKQENVIATYPTKYYSATDKQGLSKAFETISNQISSSLGITNVKVVDPLSDKVAPVTANGEYPTTLWLYEGAIPETGVTDVWLSENGTPLTGTLQGTESTGRTVEYKKTDGTLAATYYIDDVTVDGETIKAKTISWAVADSLPSGTTKALIYQVKVTAAYDADQFKTPDSETGTHANNGQSGFYSNGNGELSGAYLYYNSNKDKAFPHPVVLPSVPTGKLTITKKVTDTTKDYAGLTAEAKKFGFTVTLTGITAASIKVTSPDGVFQDISVSEEGTAKLADIQLAANETYVIDGLNKEAEYSITEKEYQDTRYYSELDSVEVKENDTAVEPGTRYNPATRTITGNMNDDSSEGEQATYSLRVAKEVDANGKLVYEERQTIGKEDYDAATVKKGWYHSNGDVVQDNELYEPGGKTQVLMQTEPGVTTYTWMYDGKKVSANGADNAEMNSALATVTGWLTAQKYEDVTIADTTVSASKQWAEEKKFVYYLLFGWSPSDPTDFDAETYEKDKGYDGFSVIENENYGINKKYTFYKNVPVTIASTETKTETRTYWSYDGGEYDSTEALIAAITANGRYRAAVSSSNETTVEYWQMVPKSNETLAGEGYEYREYTATSAAVPPLKVGVTFNNKFKERESISIEKKVAGDPEMIPVSTEPETYIFEVQKRSTDGQTYNPFDGYTIGSAPEGGAEKVMGAPSKFTVAGTGTVELLIDKSELGNTYRIVEVNAGTASAVQWEDSGVLTAPDENRSTDVSNGGEVTCTNYYFNNTLTIAKQLDPASCSGTPDNLKCFTYEVELKDKSGAALTSVSYDSIPEGASFTKGTKDENTKTIALENGKFVFIMPAGASLTLNKLPAGTSYTVKEIPLNDANYKDTVTAHSAIPENSSTYTEGDRAFTGNFAAVTAETKGRTVSYTNKMERKIGKLLITKKLVGKDQQTAYEAAEAVTFTFQIKGEDGKSFYASVIVPAGKSEAYTEVFEVPAGQYTITELPTLRFDSAGEAEKTITVVEYTGADTEVTSAVFTNYRTGSGYLSDTSTTVNAVKSPDGFEPKTEESKNKRSLLYYLLPGGAKEDDESGDDN